MVALQIMIIEPIEQNIEGSRKFAEQVESIREKNNSQVWFFDFGPDGDELKFLANIPQEKRFIPQFISTSLPQEATPVDKNYVEANTLKQYIKRILMDIFPDKYKGFPEIEPRYLCYGIGKIETLPNKIIYISKAKNFESKIPKELKQNLEVIVSGKMGHQKCVAFKKKG
jgi:hypothetical protein